MSTIKLLLTELANGQSNYLNANATFAMLDQLVHQGVLDKDLAAPPGSPGNGAAYIVAASATGAWSGKSGQIAYWLNASGVWQFIVPRAGFRVSVIDETDSSGAPIIYAYTGAAWVIPGVPVSTVVPDATAARTLGLADSSTYLRFTASGAVVCTIPPQASVAWPAGTEVNIRRAGAGNLTLTPGSGVTLNIPSGGTLVISNGMTVTLKRVASNEWDVIGQTVPA